MLIQANSLSPINESYVVICVHTLPPSKIILLPKIYHISSLLLFFNFIGFSGLDWMDGSGIVAHQHRIVLLAQ